MKKTYGRITHTHTVNIFTPQSAPLNCIRRKRNTKDSEMKQVDWKTRDRYKTEVKEKTMR